MKKYLFLCRISTSPTMAPKIKDVPYYEIYSIHQDSKLNLTQDNLFNLVFAATSLLIELVNIF